MGREVFLGIYLHRCVIRDNKIHLKTRGRPPVGQGLTQVEQQTLQGLSETFGIKVYVRNSKGELVTVSHG
ncbi:MAG: hypothetical protein ACE5JU_14235 [Candidatus Binatia bacterium]